MAESVGFEPDTTLLPPIGHLQRAPSDYHRLQVEVGLHVHPELRRRFEELRELERLQELLEEDLARVHRRPPARGITGMLSVVVLATDVVRIVPLPFTLTR
jgi:hypothetical protein